MGQKRREREKRQIERDKTGARRRGDEGKEEGENEKGKKNSQKQK